MKIDPDILRQLEVAIAQTVSDLVGKRITVHKGYPPASWPVGQAVVRAVAVVPNSGGWPAARLQLVVEVIDGNFDAWGPPPAPGDLYLFAIPRDDGNDVPLRVTVDDAPTES